MDKSDTECSIRGYLVDLYKQTRQAWKTIDRSTGIQDHMNTEV